MREHASAGRRCRPDRSAPGCLISTLTRRVLVALVLMLRLPAWADEVDAKLKILWEVAQVTGTVCYKVADHGTSKQLLGSAKGSAELSGIVAKLANVDLSIGGEAKTEEYQGVLREQLAEAMIHSVDCGKTVFPMLVERLVPPLQTASVGALPRVEPAETSYRKDAHQEATTDERHGTDVGLSVVEAFYNALSRADGSIASGLVVPEKRTGNYDPGNIKKFYSSLSERLRLLQIIPIESDEYQVAYTYRAGNNVCAGAARVYLENRNGQTLIKKIKVQAHC